MESHKNPWKTLDGKLIYENPWIRVDEFNVINPSGGKGIYGKVSFKGAVPENETLEIGAKRELKEETGLHCQELEFLCKIHTSNSVTDEVGFAYLATGLTEGETNFDDTEDISIQKLPFTEVLEMVLDGRITDSLSVAAIMRFARKKGI